MCKQPNPKSVQHKTENTLSLGEFWIPRGTDALSLCLVMPRGAALVHITLISTVTFNLTLQKVNHVTTNAADLCFNLFCSRWESQTRFRRVATQSFHGRGRVRRFWQTELWDSALPFPEGCESGATMVDREWHHCRGTMDSRQFPTSLSCALSKTRCFHKEMKPKSHSI